MTYSAETDAKILKAIVDLCRELSRTGTLNGLQVQMRDAIPRLELTTSSGVVVDVRIDEQAEHFVWRPAYRRHPLSDVPGATCRIAEFIAECGHRVPGAGG